MWGISHGILLVPQNIVMDLNDVMISIIDFELILQGSLGINKS